MRLGTREREFVHVLAMGIWRLVLMPIVKVQAVDVVDERFGRCVLGQDQRVVLDLDMIDFRLARSVLDAN
jgi:hypothetical protein